MTETSGTAANTNTRWSAAFRGQVGELELDVQLHGDTQPLALVGPNGSGKTTVLRMLAGAVPAPYAEVYIDGVYLASTADGVHLPMEQRGIGYVPQGHGLFPHLCVLDNVAFGLAVGPTKFTRAERETRARLLLDELGCAELERRAVDRLSGGEQQRVALTRALVVEPRMLLLDEPLAALDATTRRRVRRVLARKLSARRRPTIVVTHDARDVAALDAYVCVLERGRVVQRGSLAQLRTAPASAFVAEFVDTDH